jgi:5-methylcytosine-specific restriction endonuclease McrA
MSDLNTQTAYEWYLGSEFWAAKRQAALARANYLCQLRLSRCTGQATEIHHKTYVRVFNELATDLVASCSNCHRDVHHHKPACNDNLPPLPVADDGTP